MRQENKPVRGWLFDLYPRQPGGVTLWVIGEDGQRYRFWQPFRSVFYAAGQPSRLRDLWRFLSGQDTVAGLSRVERRDLFQSRPMPVMGVEANTQEALQQAFFKAQAAFPDLDYYDVDISLSLRHAAMYDTFPLGWCEFALEGEQVKAIAPLETPWDLDPATPALRILRLEPDTDPGRSRPLSLKIQYGRASYSLPFNFPRPLLINLSAILNQFDPDLILTRWGDTWLFPRLLDLSKEWNIPIPFNRDHAQDITVIEERSYLSYGQIVYRGQQIHLFGRWHIDSNNALLYQDFELEGIYETARVTRLPAQVSARVSPGTGISSMQMVTALQNGILIPWRKQQGEKFKTALELIQRDQGGMVYQPLVGVHKNVAELDFVSMYPGLMVRFNISPETAGEQAGHPESLEPFPGDTPGLVPLTLAPLLEKRLKLKARIKTLSKWDARLKSDRTRAIAHKWLLVTCFGYLGYKNARFGRIEAHEAVTAYGREALLRAKEAAESLDCNVIQLYIDGMWVKHPAWETAKEFQPVLNAIMEDTRLPIALEGVYRWIAFLPSRQDHRIPVPNRYFGVFQDGTLKVRGIEARRRDTPEWIANTQMAILELLAGAESLEKVDETIPGALDMLHREWQDLRAGNIPLERLLLSQRLGRELGAYQARAPVARAVLQLNKAGKSVKPGQRVRYLFTRGEPGVYAWDSGEPPRREAVSLPQYQKLLARAAGTVLQPFGVEQADLWEWITSGKKPIKQLPLKLHERGIL